MTVNKNPLQEIIRTHAEMFMDKGIPANGMRGYIETYEAGYRQCLADNQLNNDATGFAIWLEMGMWTRSTDTRFPPTLHRWYNTPNPDVAVELTKTIDELFTIYKAQQNV
jgi:hypothetical protein